MSRRSGKRGNGLRVFLIFLILMIIIGGVALFALNAAKHKIKAAVTQKVVEETVKHIARENNMDTEQLDKLLDSVDEKDKQQVYEIIGDHLDQETLNRGLELARQGNVSSLKEMADGLLSEEEQERLMEMYEKYKNR